MKGWYSAKELVGIEGMPGTERSVNRKARTEQWRFQEVPAPGGPGGKRREYHISSLPDETRAALLTSAASHPAADPAAELESFLAARRISLSPRELADPAIQRKLACAKAYESCPAYKGRERVLAALAEKYNVTAITIRRWVDDIVSMRTRRAPRITLGEEKIALPRSASFSPEALACGLSSYANDMKAGMRAAYNRMADLQKERGWQVGDYSSFTRAVKKIPAAVWMRISKGATGFELHGLPKIVRQWTAIPAQSVVCGDQKIFDYVTYDSETDTLIKPEGYFWIDCASRMITGVWIELGHYNQYTVGNSLREALRYGIPDELFTDWGKPELSKHIAHIREGMSAIARTGDFVEMTDKYRDMDCPDHRKAQPGKPWGKPIENIMNLIDIRMKAKNLPGFRKRDPKDPWRNKEIQDLLRRQAKRGELMGIEAFIRTVFTIVDEHNRAEKKLAEGGTIIPLNFFSEGLIRRPPQALKEATLDYICLPTFERIPRGSAVHVTIRGDERTYQSHALSGWKKGKVHISVDPYNRDFPAVLCDAKGDFIDLAQPWHTQDPYDREGVSFKRHRQAELMRWVGEQARHVKEGFDLYHAPEVKKKEVVKLTSTTATAQKADEAKKVYRLRTFEDRQEQARITETAKLEQKLLAAEFAAGASEEIDGWSLPEGRDRFAHWLKMRARVGKNEALTDKEAHFYEHYPRTADYRACMGLYEDYGEIYTGGMI